MESSEKLCLVLFSKNTNLSDSCFLFSGDILCEMKIFHSKSLQGNLFREHSGFEAAPGNAG